MCPSPNALIDRVSLVLSFVFQHRNQANSGLQDIQMKHLRSEKVSYTLSSNLISSNSSPT